MGLFNGCSKGKKKAEAEPIPEYVEEEIEETVPVENYEAEQINFPEEEVMPEIKIEPTLEEEEPREKRKRRKHKEHEYEDDLAAEAQPVCLVGNDLSDNPAILKGIISNYETRYKIVSAERDSLISELALLQSSDNKDAVISALYHEKEILQKELIKSQREGPGRHVLISNSANFTGNNNSSISNNFSNNNMSSKNSSIKGSSIDAVVLGSVSNNSNIPRMASSIRQIPNTNKDGSNITSSSCTKTQTLRAGSAIRRCPETKAISKEEAEATPAPSSPERRRKVFAITTITPSCTAVIQDKKERSHTREELSDQEADSLSENMGISQDDDGRIASSSVINSSININYKQDQNPYPGSFDDDIADRENEGKYISSNINHIGRDKALRTIINAQSKAVPSPKRLCDKTKTLVEQTAPIATPSVLGLLRSSSSGNKAVPVNMNLNRLSSNLETKSINLSNSLMLTNKSITAEIEIADSDNNVITAPFDMPADNILIDNVNDANDKNGKETEADVFGYISYYTQSSRDIEYSTKEIERMTIMKARTLANIQPSTNANINTGYSNNGTTRVSVADDISIDDLSGSTIAKYPGTSLSISMAEPSMPTKPEKKRFLSGNGLYASNRHI